MHRFSILVAIAGLIAIFSGAFVTSSKVALEPGQSVPSPDVHRIMGIAALVLALAFAVKARSALRSAAWAALAGLAASGAVAWNGAPSTAMVVVHASLAQFFAGSIAAAIVLSSPAWSRAPEPVKAGQWTALRPAALATPLVVFVQTILGALYRHQITGVMPHMIGAMIVALMTLVVSVMVLQNFSGHRELKNAATALISVALAQICLGIATFVMLLLEAANTAAFVWIATAHLAVGSLTLAASVAMAMGVSRNIVE